MKKKLRELIISANNQNFFPKGDSTNWSNNLQTFKEEIIDTIPAFHINNVPERYIEALLKKLEVTMEENKQVMKYNKIWFD